MQSRVLHGEVNRQEIFDFVTRHLFTQGRPSRSASDDGCAYRGKDDTSCAVGCLIRDDEYRREMDNAKKLGSPSGQGTSVAALNEVGVLPQRLVGHLQLLADLQMVHDMCPTQGGRADRFLPDILAYRLREVAKTFDLSDQVVDEYA